MSNQQTPENDARETESSTGASSLSARESMAWRAVEQQAPHSEISDGTVRDLQPLTNEQKQQMIAILDELIEKPALDSSERKSETKGFNETSALQAGLEFLERFYPNQFDPSFARKYPQEFFDLMDQIFQQLGNLQIGKSALYDKHGLVVKILTSQKTRRLLERQWQTWQIQEELQEKFGLDVRAVEKNASQSWESNLMLLHQLYGNLFGFTRNLPLGLQQEGIRLIQQSAGVLSPRAAAIAKLISGYYGTPIAEEEITEKLALSAETLQDILKQSQRSFKQSASSCTHKKPHNLNEFIVKSQVETGDKILEQPALIKMISAIYKVEIANPNSISDDEQRLLYQALEEIFQVIMGKIKINEREGYTLLFKYKLLDADPRAIAIRLNIDAAIVNHRLQRARSRLDNPLTEKKINTILERYPQFFRKS